MTFVTTTWCFRLEFQREYVWTREQSKQLMVSLSRGYPVGGVLFWKTTEPPELKVLPEFQREYVWNVDQLPDSLGTGRYP